MKKLYISILVLSILTNPTISLATSGACSSHGGVSCSLSNSSKSIICNDGWTDSSTSYNNLSECKNVQCDSNSVAAYAINKGLSGSNVGESLINQCNNFNKNLENKNNSNTYTSPSPISTDDFLKYKMQQFCIQTYGANSFSDWANKKCECQTGYIKNIENKNICEKESEVNEPNLQIKKRLDEICTESVGVESVWDYSVKKDAGNLQCNPSREQLFNSALDDLFSEALENNPDFPKDFDKELIRKIVTSPDYRNIPVSDVMRKYFKENNLLIQNKEPVKNNIATTLITTEALIKKYDKKLNVELPNNVIINENVQLYSKQTPIMNKERWYKKVFTKVRSFLKKDSEITK